MNKSLVRRLDNLEVKGNEIDFFELRDILFQNKDYRSETQLKNAIDYLKSARNVEVTDVPSYNIIAAKKVTLKQPKKKTEKEVLEEKKLEELEEEFEEIEDESEDDSNIFESNETEISALKVRDPIGAYLTNVSDLGYDVFTREEEQELFRRVKAGDEEAKRIAIEANLKLVVSIAKTFTNNSSVSCSFLDMIQEGNLGLMKAIDRFDPELGYKFSTYATWWIKQSITRALADTSKTIRIPVHMVDQVMAIIKVIEIWKKSHEDKDPTPEEIADYCNENGYNRKSSKINGERPPLTADEVTSYLNYYNGASPVSLEKPVGDEEDAILGDFIPDEFENSPAVQAENTLLREDLEKCMNTWLSPREIKVVKCRMGWENNVPMTLEEIGVILGVTRERIRQIENKALRKLKFRMRFMYNRDTY